MIFEIQHKGTNVGIDKIEQEVKKIWKKSGRKINEITSLRIYYVPEELNAYFIVNEKEMTGTISIEGIIEG